MRIGISLVVALLGAVEALSPKYAFGSSAAVLRDGSSIIVSTSSGQLILWKRGEVEPVWSLQTHGFSLGARSPIAALSVLPNNSIVAVENGGRILHISENGKIISAYRPFYGFVRLKPDFLKVDWTDWAKQVDYFSSTSAAYVDADARYVYLVPNEWVSVTKIELDKLLKLEDGVISLSEHIVFEFKDHNFFTSIKSGPPSVSLEGEWTTEPSWQPSTVAACGGWLIVGSKEGYVEFIPEAKNLDKDRRLRQVGDQKRDPRNVIDAGCINDKLAYTVSFDTGHGEIQLWDVVSRNALSWVGLESNGHPGMAYVAAASASGEELLSLGDVDVRLWKISERKLTLLSKYFLEYGAEESQHFAVVSLGSGDFVLSDGQRLWRVPSDGGEESVYAGPPPRK